MHRKALYILHIYIDSDNKKHDLSRLRPYYTSAGYHLLLSQYRILLHC